jgi:ribosomal protein S18 acetylase RimI-like enzyme
MVAAVMPPSSPDDDRNISVPDHVAHAMTAPTGSRPHDPADAVLDNPAWASLTGAHAHLAEVNGRAARYPDDIAPFMAVGDMQDPLDWLDLGALVGPGAGVMAATPLVVPVPAGWVEDFSIAGVQLVDTSLRAERDPEAVELGPDDVAEMLELIARTQPGPFLPRTVELGRYVGIRRQGELIAMAGERLSPPGWTEISAVCTDVDYRGQGLATRLVRDVAAGIRARGATPFLHTSAANTAAIRLYESLGFTLRAETHFRHWTTPLNA